MPANLWVDARMRILAFAPIRAGLIRLYPNLIDSTAYSCLKV